MSIREKIDKLPSEERKRLYYAFEYGLSQYISVEDNMFVGVNVRHVRHLSPTEITGAWAYGHDRSKQNI